MFTGLNELSTDVNLVSEEKQKILPFMQLESKKKKIQSKRDEYF